MVSPDRVRACLQRPFVVMIKELPSSSFSSSATGNFLCLLLASLVNEPDLLLLLLLLRQEERSALSRESPLSHFRRKKRLMVQILSANVSRVPLGRWEGPGQGARWAAGGCSLPGSAPMPRLCAAAIWRCAPDRRKHPACQQRASSSSHSTYGTYGICRPPSPARSFTPSSRPAPARHPPPAISLLPHTWCGMLLGSPPCTRRH